MTTEAEPSAMTYTKQARTGRDSSGTIHVRAWSRLDIWWLPDSGMQGSGGICDGNTLNRLLAF